MIKSEMMARGAHLDTLWHFWPSTVFTKAMTASPESSSW
jgi:hypothetical protein